MALVVKDIYNAYRPVALPPPGAFAGQAVCVVGGTTGLGLAAALHCVRLGAAEVYITARDEARGEAARRQLADAAAARGPDGPPCTVAVLSLDLGRFASVTAFAEELRGTARPGAGGLDYLLLNAAVLPGDYVVGAEGWAAELQVNALGTVLLARLMLPWFRAERRRRAAPAHLAWCGSGAALGADPADWERRAGAGENVLAFWNQRENWPGGRLGGYGVSKTLALYAVREMVNLARDEDGRPWVIINIVDPGMVKTEIQRHMTANSLFLKLLAPPFSFLFMKTPENGSRVMVKGGLTSEAEHGHLLAGYLTNEAYQCNAVVASDAGKRMQARVWHDMTEVLCNQVPTARAALEGGDKQ